MVLLLERDLVSWSLAIDERGGHGDLHSSSRRSVISYVHGRTDFYCSSLSCQSLSFLSAPVKRRLPEPFITQGQAVTLRLGARQVIPWWLKPYTTSRVLMARNNK
jgi:hypothetical protein